MYLWGSKLRRLQTSSAYEIRIFTLKERYKETVFKKNYMKVNQPAMAGIQAIIFVCLIWMWDLFFQREEIPQSVVFLEQERVCRTSVTHRCKQTCYKRWQKSLCFKLLTWLALQAPDKSTFILPYSHRQHFASCLGFIKGFLTDDCDLNIRNSKCQVTETLIWSFVHF